MSRYCLDTSAYSFFIRGEARVVELIDSADWLGLPAMVLAELWIGFAHGSHIGRNESALQDFITDPIVEQLIVDHHVARIYSEIAVDLRRAGTPIPVNDMWVAACAVRHGAAVLTFDTHFNFIKRVGSIVLSASS